MAVSLASVAIYRARRTLEDIGPAYKWKDVELIGYCDEGQNEIIRNRPDSTASSLDTEPPDSITAITALGTTLAIDDMFLPELVNYIVEKANQKRASFVKPE